MFASCTHIKELWEDIRVLVDPLLSHQNIDSLQLMMLNFDGCNYEAEII